TTPTASHGWLKSEPSFPRPISPGAGRRPTEARHTSGSRDRRSSSNMLRKAGSITYTRSIAIPRMTTERSLPASRRVLLGFVAAFVLASGAGMSAHRYDEFLQAARIGVESDHVRLEMSLTPGMAVASDVVREIDVDGDGVLSPGEQHSYAEQVLDHLTLLVDDSQPIRLALAQSNFPDPTAMQNGDAAIDIRLKADLPQLGDGAHR